MTKITALRVPAKPLTLAIASAFFSAGVAAQTTPGTLPSGGVVTSGGATLTYTPNKLQIDQSTNKAILQWDNFSIGSSAWVNFSQPSSSSVALNRVAGTNPSEIFGRLTSNGQVFLTNPNGVLFAPGGSVEVGGLFATTLSIADHDFLNGRYNFYNAGAARSVVNSGNIVTTNGYAALAGPQVRNDGVIVARMGSVALAAGDRVSLDMVGDGLIRVSVDQAAVNASAINAGTIEADGGRVVLSGRSANALLDTVVNNSGIIRANSLVERNGEIILASSGDVSVGNTVMGGSLAIDAGGTVAVRNAMVRSVGGQTINARAVEVTATGGGFTSLWNSGGAQTISATGGAGVDVRFAQVQADAGSSQAIRVVNGDHIAVDGGAIIAFNSPQTLSITGHGANAIRMGSAGTFGSSIAHGSLHQSVTAGAAGESGSITIVGPAGNGALAGLFTNPNAGGTQTISTAGNISITGGNASNQPANFFTGISHNGSGRQDITAAGITLAAGSTGNGNVATLSSFGGGVAANSGDQLIHVSGGDIRVTGGASGLSNRAQIVSFANQTIDGGANIVLAGGAGGTGSAALNTHNAATISASTAGRTQSIEAGTITLTGGGGRDAFAMITGANQAIGASGDVRLTGGSGPGNPVARIGSLGVVPTNLTLNAANVSLTGGSAAGAEAALGSSGVGIAQPTSITVNATGDVMLTAGAAPARIGTSLILPTPATGDISIAGRSIQLAGGASPSVVRTAGRVSLAASGDVREVGNAFVVASALDATSGGVTSLGGANQVASFSGSAGGDMALNNASPLLTLGALNSGGVFTLKQFGDASFTRSATLGAMDAQASGSVYVLGGAADGGSTLISAMGPMRIATGGDLRITGGSGASAFAALKGYSDIDVTLGGTLRINAGTGSDAYARLQTADRDSAINLHFVNLPDGGYFVNDIEGALRRGHSGILSGEGVAVPNHTLHITYGQ